MTAFADTSWSDRIDEAIWIRERLAPFRSFIVNSVVPGGFDTYARILHPVSARPPEAHRALRWRDVAAWAGTMLRADAQFHSVALPPDRPAGQPPWEGLPEAGNMDPADAEALAEVLCSETVTPKSCWFCLWEGFGWVDSVVPERAWNGPRVNLPQRNYLLYKGPVEAAVLTSEGGRLPVTQSASLWWPNDRAWCVATEIDLPWTYIGGSLRLIERVLHDPRLEALPSAAGEPLTRVETWVRQRVEEAASELLRVGQTTIVTSAGSVEAQLDRPRLGRSGELRFRTSEMRWGSTNLGRGDDENLRAAIASCLTWQVEGLAGI